MNYADILRSVFLHKEEKKYTDLDMEKQYTNGFKDGKIEGIKDGFNRCDIRIATAEKIAAVIERNRILELLQKTLEKNTNIEQWTVLVRNLINGGLK